MPPGRPKLGDSPSWTEADDRILRREWKKGALSKAIGHMLDPPRTGAGVNARATRLGLPARGKISRQTRLMVEISKKEKEIVRGRAHQLGMPMARYIRMLIRRDNGL